MSPASASVCVCVGVGVVGDGGKGLKNFTRTLKLN